MKWCLQSSAEHVYFSVFKRCICSMHCPNDKNGPMYSRLCRALRMSTFIYKGVFATQSNSFIYLFTYLILERGDGRERNNDRWPPACTPVRNQTNNPGMCPDQESNLRPFVLWDDTPPTEPYQTGLIAL